MKTIIITGINTTANKGCWAMLYTAVTTIRKNSRVPINFVFLKRKTFDEEKRLKELGINFEVRPWTLIDIPKLRTIWIFLCFFYYPAQALLAKLTKQKKIRNGFIRQMLDSDLILDLGGDSYSIDYPLVSIFSLSITTLVARILGKPYFYCAQSIGPFNNSFAFKFLKFLLKDAALITTRERITDKILSHCGIKENVIQSQDLSFLLSPPPKKRIHDICKKENVNTIYSFAGLSISNLITMYFNDAISLKEKTEQYIEVMAHISDYLIENYSYTLLLIPHVEADRDISERVKAAAKNKNKIYIIQGDYSPTEIKGLVGLCDIFIGSRMHATLAALSQAIPTLTFVYNHKTIGINGIVLGQNEYLIDIRQEKLNKLFEISKNKLDKIVKRKEYIKKNLREILPHIIKESEKNAIYALDLLEVAGPVLEMNDPLNCTGCGTCVSACPSNSIIMRKTCQGTYRPGFKAICNNCGLCFKVCPMLGFNIQEHEKNLLNQSATDSETGIVKQAYAGYALDKDIRFNGSSGGLVTTVASYLLSMQKVGAVLLVVTDLNDSLKFHGKWITSADEVYQCKGSKYIPIPLNDALQDIPKNTKKIAVVGLPCHLWGLKLYEDAGIFKNVKVEYRISLFCGRTPNSHATDFIIKNASINSIKIKSIQYRGRGWPSGLRIESEGDHFSVPQGKIWPQVFGTPYFLPVHCYRCPDFFGYLSDLSFGDGWMPDLSNDGIGWSACLTRSLKGDDLLKEMIANKKIYLMKYAIADIKKTFNKNLENKIRRKSIKDKLFCSKSPVFYLNNNSIAYKNRCLLGEIFYLFLIKISISQFFRDKFLKFPQNKFMIITNKVASKLLFVIDPIK